MSGELHVYSNPTIDVIGDEHRAGGPGLYAALAATILGFRVRVHGAIGSDGLWVVEEYLKRGALIGELRLHLDEATTRFRLVYNGSERRVIVEEPGPLNMSVSLREPRIVSPVLREFEEGLLISLARGSFLDVQGLVRPRRRGVVEYEHDPVCRRALETARVVHGDVWELVACLDVHEPRELVHALILLSRDTSVIATMGYGGSLLFDDGRVYHVPAWGPRTGNPTGMGDVMLAATAALTLIHRLDLLDAVRAASVVCGFHAQGAYERRSVESILRLAPEPSRIEVDQAVSLVKRVMQHG